MKPVLLSLFCLSTALVSAADDPKIAAVKTADETRLTAMKAGDREGLDAIFSGDLHYAHSNGKVDSKASFMEALTTGKTKYTGFAYEERNFTFPAPGIALMSGRVRIQVENATGKMDNVLSYLAVWREEKGQWRFLAWQSCKLPPATAP